VNIEQHIERLSDPKYRLLVAALIWVVSTALALVNFLLWVSDDPNDDVRQSWAHADIDDTQPIPIIKEPACV
jgi:hypothetical protein